MKKIHVEFSDERLITPSGLVFVGQILGKSSFVKKINRTPVSKEIPMPRPRGTTMNETGACVMFLVSFATELFYTVPIGKGRFQFGPVAR